MSRIKYGTHVSLYPMPVTLLGVHVGNKPNFMTLGWVSRVNADPPLIGCGVARNHYTNRGMTENKTFSINIPTASMLEKTDFCGLASGKLFDKSGLFEVFYGELGSAPMIAECPVAMECRLTQTIENPSNNFYIGEIVASYTGEEFLTGGHPDIKKINPLLLTMPDNRYWTVGAYAGDAWKAGMVLKEQSAG